MKHNLALAMEEPEEGPVGDRLVASVDAHGLHGEIWARTGRESLQMEVAIEMNGELRRCVASAETEDVALARSRTVSFLRMLALQLKQNVPDIEGNLRRPTYARLLEEISRRGKDVANLRTQVRTVMDILGLDETDPIGAEFGEEFDVTLARLRRELQHRGLSRKTISPYLTRVRRLKRLVDELTIFAGDGTAFTDALAVAMRRRNVTVSALARATGVAPATIRRWREGVGLPTDRRDVVPLLEAALQLPEGSLQRLLPTVSLARKGKPRVNLDAFASRLRSLIRERGLSNARVVRETGINWGTLQHWTRAESLPGLRSRKTWIPLLEKYFGLASGELDCLLGPVAVEAIPYRWCFNDLQEEEWQQLVKHKTDRAEPDQGRRPKSYWKQVGDECPSAVMMKYHVARFWGFLTLPKRGSSPGLQGLGLDGNARSLLDLANKEYVFAYIRFLGARNGMNSSVLSVLRFICSLLRPRTGYLWQGHSVPWEDFPPEFLLLGNGQSPDGSRSQWREHCEGVWKAILDHLCHMADNKLVKPSRGYGHIAKILDRDRPMDVLCLLVARMAADLDARARYLSEEKRARMVRDRVFVELLIRLQLRRKHWMHMTYREDGTGHLRRRDGGHYDIVIPKEEFKALAHFRNEDYHVQLPESLTVIIDDYLANHRARLEGADACDLLFRPVKGLRRPSASVPFAADIILVEITKRYLSDYVVRGFSTHAVRHIVATHLVRNHEDGVERAADALHNTREMIERTYGHMRGRDRTRRAQRIIQNELDKGISEVTTDD